MVYNGFFHTEQTNHVLYPGQEDWSTYGEICVLDSDSEDEIEQN